MKISTKIAILFTLLVLLIFTIASFVVIATVNKNVQRDFRKRLESKISGISAIYSSRQEDFATLLKIIDSRSTSILSNKTIIILDSANNQVYDFNDPDTKTVSIQPEWIAKTKESGEGFFNLNDGRQILLRYFSKKYVPDYIVAVASENRTEYRYNTELKKALWITAPFILILALIIGFIFYRGLISPVKTIIHDARLISSSNLSHRLFVGRQKDELAELKTTINDLLQRLEDSFNTQRRFISNASHELSTPLTSISSQLEVALLTDNPKEYYRNVIQSVLDDTKELHHLTHALLQIAQGSKAGAMQLDKVRTDEVLLKVHADLVRQHPEYMVSINFGNFPENDNDCSVYGNEQLVYSILKNIIINGCKYSPDNAVSVEMSFADHKIIFKATNKSVHLTAEEISLLFEPFYRSSNAGEKEGYGLGLALTKKLVQLHRGTVEAAYTDNGHITFTVIFPAITTIETRTNL